VAGRDADGAKLAGFYLRQRRGVCAYGRLHASAHQVDQALRVGFVMHEGDFGAGHVVQHGAGQVGGATQTSGGEVQLVRIGPGLIDAFLDRLERRIGVRQQEVGFPHQQRDRRQVINGVIMNCPGFPGHGN